MAEVRRAVLGIAINLHDGVIVKPTGNAEAGLDRSSDSEIKR